MNSIKRYHAIAKALGAMRRGEASNNDEWRSKHSAAIFELCGDLPSGSGFDSGSRIDLDGSTPDRLVFTTSYHHMNDGGCYDGWTEHTVVVTPSLEMGCHIKVTGRNRNDIKDYIGEQFCFILESDVEQWTGYPKAEQAVA